MQRATRDRIQYAFDRHPEPVLRVAPGEVFEVETEDARTGKTRAPETTTPGYVKSLRGKGTYYGNPVTGPLWIEGAAPGDTLAVSLHAMECDTLGFFGYWPFIYHLQDWFEEPFTGLVDIQGGAVSYTMQTQSGPHRIRIPTRPMAGCIGTAPELAVPTTSDAGRFGGNLDVPEVCPHSTIYLPVSVPGGYLYLGDCHPYQGDGELAGCEMRSLIRLSVLKVRMSDMLGERPGAVAGGDQEGRPGFDGPVSPRKSPKERRNTHGEGNRDAANVRGDRRGGDDPPPCRSRTPDGCTRTSGSSTRRSGPWARGPPST
jgi:acetamidase/formamidase